MERKRPYPSDDDFDNNDRPAAHSASSGLALLSGDGWRDVCPYLEFYQNATLRFVSGALNRLVYRNSSSLPLRVIAALVAGHVNEGYGACGFEADLRTPWRDLLPEVRASPESMLHDVLSRCEGLVIASLDLRDLPYNDKVVEALTQRLTSVTVSEVCFNGVTSGHDRVHPLLEIIPGLRSASLKNDAAHPNAAAFLGVCASRKIPNATLRYAADVTDEAIIHFLFDINTPRITRQFGILRLRRSLSENIFELIVERCRHNVAKSLRFGVAGILTDPTDAKYERFVVERDDCAAMYRFRQADQAFSILVGIITTTGRFYLKVFQGEANDLCTSLAAAKNIFTCRIYP